MDIATILMLAICLLVLVLILRRINKAADVERLQVEKARLEMQLDLERTATAEKLELLRQSEARLKTEFENLANRIFEDKGKAITAENRERIAALLLPLKDQIESFRRRVDEIHRDDTEQSARLREQVRQLQDLSNKVSDEANNLARAIKGDAKTQGDWGELVVERIFEASGLEIGIQYEKQPAIRDEAGSLKKPDFIVHLPGKTDVIVDSKVSLTAFVRYSSAEPRPDRDSTLKEHIQSVRAHVAELAAKDYGRLLDGRNPDFVIMCIPIEPAYQLALKADPDLIPDAASKKVVITGPTTLMLTLKTIAQLWRRENENRNAMTIADQAGRLYDQVVLVADAMLDAKKNLEAVMNSFQIAIKRLKEGKGNLVNRVEELRKLGAKVGKQFPRSVLDDAQCDDEKADA